MSCCGQKIRGITNVAQNFVLSVANAVTHAIKTKKVLAERSVTEKRVSTCKSCQYLSANRCKSCGCFIVVKTAIESEKCPKGYW